MTAVLTAPDQIHEADINGVKVSAQLTVDGGVTITVWSGPSRHNSVSWTYTDLALGRQRYATIRDLAQSGQSADQITETLATDAAAVLGEAQQILNADDTEAGQALSAQIGDAAEALTTDAQRAADDELVARMRQDFLTRPRNWRQIRDDFAAGMTPEPEPVATLPTLEQIRGSRIPAPRLPAFAMGTAEYGLAAGEVAR